MAAAVDVVEAVGRCVYSSVVVALSVKWLLLLLLVVLVVLVFSLLLLLLFV